MEPIGILRSDQFHTVSMHLTELFLGKDMQVTGMATALLWCYIV